jgi:cytochrome b pre-mRNA-processing protein 3
MFGIFTRAKRMSQAMPLFSAIIAAARAPELYTRHQVPDTFEGRFEAASLVMAHVLRALKALPAPSAALSQDLVDLWFDFLDESLRKAGIGDLSVSKKMKGLARGFYGRLGAYDAALASTDRDAMRLALSRNVLGDAAGANSLPDGLLAWQEVLDVRIRTLTLADLLAGASLLPDPATQPENAA